MRLARNLESLAAGRQYPQLRAGAQQGIGESGARGHQMLAVVQDQEYFPTLQILHERLGHGAFRRLSHRKRRGYRLWHEVGVRERRKLDKPHAVFEVFR